MNKRSIVLVAIVNSLLGDIGFTTILFGGLAVLENRVAWMREGSSMASVSA